MKFGYLVPQFTAFNEVKTKFPLIPYILRPLIYESSLNDIIEGEAYIPTHAALQINGTAGIGKTKIDYSLFGGNSEYVMSKGIKGTKTNYTPSGSDTTNFKMIGGRIGTRLYGLKLGVSSTYDETRNDRINKIVDDFNSLSGLNVANLGHIPRWRLGLDLSYIWKGLTFESEYIYVNQYPDDEEKSKLDVIINATQYRGPNNIPLFPTISDDLSQQFFYVCLTYDFLEKYYISCGFSQFDTKWDLLLRDKGVQSIWGGCGYRINDNITLKLQLTSIQNDLFDDPRVKIKIFTAHVAASVYF